MANAKVEARDGGMEPITPVVGLLVAAFVAALIYGIANNAITPEVALWCAESLPVTAVGGAIIYIVATVVRG